VSRTACASVALPLLLLGLDRLFLRPACRDARIAKLLVAIALTTTSSSRTL